MAKSRVKQRRKGKPVKRVGGIDRARAEQMAQGLDEYDSRIVGGRLTR